MDWPNYKGTGEFQKTVSANETLERLSTFGTVHKGAKNIELRRFECGYYDGGVKYRDPYSLVQAGCEAYTFGTIETQTETGEQESWDAPFINVIPAGVDVEWDDSWPETWAIGGDGDFCVASSLSNLMSIEEVEEPTSNE